MNYPDDMQWSEIEVSADEQMREDLEDAMERDLLPFMNGLRAFAAAAFASPGDGARAVQVMWSALEWADLDGLLTDYPERKPDYFKPLAHAHQALADAAYEADITLWSK